MLKKSLLTLGLVAAMGLSISGAFAQNFDHRADHRNMKHNRGNFEHARRNQQHHFAANHHKSARDHRGRR